MVILTCKISLKILQNGKNGITPLNGVQSKNRFHGWISRWNWRRYSIFSVLEHFEADFTRQNDHFKECLAAATKLHFFEIFFSEASLNIKRNILKGGAYFVLTSYLLLNRANLTCSLISLYTIPFFVWAANKNYALLVCFVYASDQGEDWL